MLNKAALPSLQRFAVTTTTTTCRNQSTLAPTPSSMSTTTSSPSSAPLSNASAATAAATESDAEINAVVSMDPSGLFSRWSLYPLLSMIGVIGLAKEYILICEESLLATLAFMMWTTVYINAKQPILDTFEQERAASLQAGKTVRDIAIDHANRLVLQEKFNETYPDDVRSLLDEEKRLATMVVDYSNIKYRHDLRNLVVRKLQLVQRIEVEERARIQSDTGGRIMQTVCDSFKNASPEVKAQLIDISIDLLPPSLTTTVTLPRDHPVVAAFLEAKSKKATAEELGFTSFVPKMVERDVKEVEAFANKLVPLNIN